MKNLTMSLIIFAMFASMTPMNAQKSASNVSKKEARKELREKQKIELVAQLTKAILDKSFTFTAFTMNANFASTQIISNQYNYMRIQPNLLDFVLPYRSTSVVPNSPFYLDFEVANYTYSVDTTVPGMLYVNIGVQNAMNQAADNTGLALNMSYRIQLEVFLSTSNAVLTVMPDFYSAVSYNGFVKVE